MNAPFSTLTGDPIPAGVPARQYERSLRDAAHTLSDSVDAVRDYRARNGLVTADSFNADRETEMVQAHYAIATAFAPRGVL